MTRKIEFPVTGILADDAAKTSFTSVPGLVLNAVEVRAGILGGTNGAGEVVPGGWHAFICDECGETHEWCPRLREALGAR